MKIFLSIFAVPITVFFFFSLSAAYSWIFHFSATIHKNYMFIFCNSLLVFICLNSRSSVSPKNARRKQAAGHCQSGSLNRSGTVGEVGNEKEMGLLHVVQARQDRVLMVRDDDEKDCETLSNVVEEVHDQDVAGVDKTLPDNVQGTRDDELEAVETQDDGLEVVEDEKNLSVVEGTHDDELEVVEDDKILSVIEGTHCDELEVVEDGKPPSVEETQDDELEMVEGDDTPLVVEETQNDELEATEDYKTCSVVEETQDDDDDEKEQGGSNSIDTITLEELHRKCEEFIRRMKEDIRVEILTVECH